MLCAAARWNVPRQACARLQCTAQRQRTRLALEEQGFFLAQLRLLRAQLRLLCAQLRLVRA